MSRFKLPPWLNQHLFEYEDFKSLPASRIYGIRDGLKRFYRPQNPVATISIPAYNEEKNILRTLSSLSKLEITMPLELRVINNNSSDRTQEILDFLGVDSAQNPEQGISFTRQMGLELANGTIILNADADSIYPPGWAQGLIDGLNNREVSVVYTRYSFIPSMGNTRFELGLYELLAEALFDFRSRTRGYLNVMGFSFAFRKSQGMQVGGFNTSRPRWSDGWMAMSLQNLGKIKCLRTSATRVYTSDRRLVADGTLRDALSKRAKKEMNVFLEYILPKEKKEAREVREKVSKPQ